MPYVEREVDIMLEEAKLFLNLYSIGAVSVIIIFGFFKWKIYNETIVLLLIGVLIYLTNIYW